MGRCLGFIFSVMRSPWREKWSIWCVYFNHSGCCVDRRETRVDAERPIVNNNKLMRVIQRKWRGVRETISVCVCAYMCVCLIRAMCSTTALVRWEIANCFMSSHFVRGTGCHSVPPAFLEVATSSLGRSSEWWERVWGWCPHEEVRGEASVIGWRMDRHVLITMLVDLSDWALTWRPTGAERNDISSGRSLTCLRPKIFCPHCPFPLLLSSSLTVARKNLLYKYSPECLCFTEDLITEHLQSWFFVSEVGALVSV